MGSARKRKSVSTHTPTLYAAVGEQLDNVSWTEINSPKPKKRKHVHKKLPLNQNTIELTIGNSDRNAIQIPQIEGLDGNYATLLYSPKGKFVEFVDNVVPISIASKGTKPEETDKWNPVNVKDKIKLNKQLLIGETLVLLKDTKPIAVPKESKQSKHSQHGTQSTIMTNSNDIVSNDIQRKKIDFANASVVPKSNVESSNIKKGKVTGIPLVRTTDPKIPNKASNSGKKRNEPAKHPNSMQDSNSNNLLVTVFSILLLTSATVVGLYILRFIQDDAINLDYSVVTDTLLLSSVEKCSNHATLQEAIPRENDSIGELYTGEGIVTISDESSDGTDVVRDSSEMNNQEQAQVQSMEKSLDKISPEIIETITNSEYVADLNHQNDSDSFTTQKGESLDAQQQTCHVEQLSHAYISNITFHKEEGSSLRDENISRSTAKYFFSENENEKLCFWLLSRRSIHLSQVEIEVNFNTTEIQVIGYNINFEVSPQLDEHLGSFGWVRQGKHAEMKALRGGMNSLKSVPAKDDSHSSVIVLGFSNLNPLVNICAKRFRIDIEWCEV